MSFQQEEDVLTTIVRNINDVNPNEEKTDTITTIKRFFSNTYYHVPFALDCLPSKNSSLVYLVIQPNFITLKKTLNDDLLFKVIFEEMAKDLSECFREWFRNSSQEIGITIKENFAIEIEREILFAVVDPITKDKKEVSELIKTEFLNKHFGRIYVDRSSQKIQSSPLKNYPKTVPPQNPQTLVILPTSSTNRKTQLRSRPHRSPPRRSLDSPPPTRGPNEAPPTPDAPSKPGHSDNYKAGVTTNIEEYYIWDVRYIHTRLFRSDHPNAKTMPKLTLLNSLESKFDFFRSRTLC